MVNYYDLVKGPKLPTAPNPYNTKWEDAARTEAAAAAPVAQPTLSAVTADIGDTFTLNNHGLVNGQVVIFKTITTTTGFSINTPYYVVGATANTFQIALTPGGSAIALTTNGSATYVASPIALAGTPFTPEHYFDPRDGAVTALPVLST